MRAGFALALAAALAFAPACFAGQGRVEGGKYHAPLDNFTVPVPRLTGLQVQEESDETGGMVAFHGDLGTNRGVVYVRLPPDMDAALRDPQKKDATYRSFVHGYVLPALYRRVSPQSEILWEEPVGDGTERELFAVARIPGGSTLVDAKTGKRLDSVRALIVFHRHDFIYMLSDELNSAMESLDTGSPLDRERLLTARVALEAMRAEMSFR
jgi:hypothetical protein